MRKTAGVDVNFLSRTLTHGEKKTKNGLPGLCWRMYPLSSLNSAVYPFTNVRTTTFKPQLSLKLSERVDEYHPRVGTLHRRVTT